VTPEQEEQVRRALGAVARHEPVTPLPADVAGRLDAVLAGLTGPEEGSEPGGAHAATGGPGRRHRRWSTVLVAAAAAAVVVLAGGVVGLRELTGSGGSHAEAGAAASASRSRSAATAQGPAALGTRGPVGSTRTVPLLSIATLTRDVQRVVDGGPVATPRGSAAQAHEGRGTAAAASGAPDTSTRPPAASSGPVSGPGSGPVTLAPPAGRPIAGCAPPPVGPDVRLLAVRLDRRPAWLAVPVAAGTRVARVYACGSTGTPLATATVQVP